MTTMERTHRRSDKLGEGHLRFEEDRLQFGEGRPRFEVEHPRLEAEHLQFEEEHLRLDLLEELRDPLSQIGQVGARCGSCSTVCSVSV